MQIDLAILKIAFKRSGIFTFWSSFMPWLPRYLCKVGCWWTKLFSAGQFVAGFFCPKQINSLWAHWNRRATATRWLVAVDGWAVTFGTARRGLGRLEPCPVPPRAATVGYRV